MTWLEARRERRVKEEQEGKEKKDKLDRYRELRAEIQDLQGIFSRVREGQATLSTYSRYIEENRSEIDALFKVIDASVAGAGVAEGDDRRHIHNQWQKLLCSPVVAQPNVALAPEEQIKELANCHAFCEEMVAHIGLLTIPARLNEWLKNGWNGYLLPFHDLFGDELPRPEDRQRLLGLLAAAPGIIRGGIVEPTSGVIFPYHEQWYWRWGACVALMAGYVATTIGIWSLAGSGLLGETNSNGREVVLGWVLVVLGVITHYAVDRSKGSGAGGVKAIPLGHPSYVIDARAGIVLLKGLLMLVGFFGLILLNPGTHGHLDFFLVGYSLDSFVGIVSSSLDKRSVARGKDWATAMNA